MDTIYEHLVPIWPQTAVIVILEVYLTSILMLNQKVPNSVSQLACSPLFVHPQAHWTFDKKWSHVVCGPNWHASNYKYISYSFQIYLAPNCCY